jgi:hypothetical protein
LVPIYLPIGFSPVLITKKYALTAKILFVSLVYIFGFRSVPNGPETESFRRPLEKLLVRYDQDTSQLKRLDIGTQEEINEAAMGHFYEISDCTTEHCVRYVWAGRVNACRAGGCGQSLPASREISHEYFEYLILFNARASILQVEVFQYRATKGHEITSAGWLKQFRKFDGSEPLRVGKEIDAIAGATISVYAITTDVEYRSVLLRSYLSETVR